MRKRTGTVVRTMLCASMLIAMGTGAATGAGRAPLQPKQLAGPATEFEAMRAQVGL